MNDMTIYQEPRQHTAVEIRAHVNLVQEVMQAVMKKDTHYGTIPGTPKPALYKPGAEVLAATFRIAVSYQTEDLSVADVVRYRVTAIGTHQTTGIVMGSGMGECSSAEEKYRWRKAVSKDEFNAAPADRRRVKYAKDYSVNQVCTNPADLANTVLKMACKRAQVAMTLNVTAASDIFTQDIEDLPEELRPQDEAKREPEKKDAVPQPYPAESYTKNLPTWTKLIASKKKTADEIIATVSSKVVLSDEQKAAIKAVKVGVDPATGETTSLLDDVKRICAEAIAIADRDTAFTKLDDARVMLPEMSEENKKLAVAEIYAAMASIKGRE